MKRLTCLLFALAIGAPGLSGAEGWMTDLTAAEEKAKAEKKILLMDFTGSDWCVWCTRLNTEVFSTKEFKAYAEKNLVLLEIDFPQKKKQSAEVKKANQALQRKYHVQGFPTVVVLNSEGKKLGQLGYLQGGPKVFLAALERLRK